MGFIGRRDFSLGWSPNSDATNAPENCLLRADNLVLDEQGVVALRRGSSKINSSPLGDPDIHSLFTAVVSGTRYRMTGADDSVYANGSSIASGLAGSDDIAFGFDKGQILFARSTSKKKYDGSTVRTWGIAKPTSAPSVTALDQDGKIITTGALGEEGFNQWYKWEGAGTLGFDDITYGDNHYEATDPLYNPVGAVQIAMAPTKRAVYERTYAGFRDFTVYDGGRVGTDDDLVSMYVYLSDPALLEGFAIQVDVNDGTFLKDWYQSPVVDGALLTASPGPNDLLPGDPIPPQYEAPLGGRYRYIVRPRLIPPRGTGGLGGVLGQGRTGWFKVSWKRSEFIRTGTTFEKGWNNVGAVRVYVKASSTALIAKVEGLRIGGGAVLGTAQWRYVYVRNASGYQALSPMSEPSTSAVFESQDAQVTIPSDASRDSQVNEIWLFRQDQLMGTYFRVQVKASVSGTSGYVLTDALATQDAITANIKIETDNLPPPDDIIAIVGPHFDRTLVLTSSGMLHPSRRLDPDAFASSQAITICGEDEVAQWMVKALDDVYIGTTKDVYRLEGTGAELPDGTIDYAKRGLSIDHPPINGAVAQEGTQLAFFSDDGWRASQGGGTTLLTGPTSLLYRGETRHGVSPVNVAAGRVRADLWKGQLVAITPEGNATSSSPVLYRLVFKTGQWYRHTYAISGNWRSIYREQDGTLIAGDDAGTVWILDTGTQDDTSDIPVTLWTKVDDCGMPFQRKKMGELSWRSDTGGAGATIAAHLDGSNTAAALFLANQTGMGVDAFDLATTLAICKQVQFRVTGSFSSFHLYDFGLQFRERPLPMIGRIGQTLAGSPGIKILSGLDLTLCTFGVARLITPILDNVSMTETFAVTTGAEEPETITLPFTEAHRARQIDWAVDCEIELDRWAPIVTQRQPLGVKAFDSGPLDIGGKQLVWMRMMFIKVRAGADLDITPYFDGVAYPTVTAPIETANVDTILEVPVGRSYVGRQPRVVIHSCEPFYPYFVEFERRLTGSAGQKPKIRVPFKLETGG